MWRTNRVAARRRSIVTLFGVAWAACGVATPTLAAEDLAVELSAAHAALTQAQAQEKAAYDARYSLDMAKAATEAIVTAQLETNGRAESLLLETQEMLRQAAEEAKTVGDELVREADAAKKKALEDEAAKLTTEQAELQQLIAARSARILSYQQQLENDRAVAARAAASYFDSERRFEEAVLGTWGATRRVHAAEATIARSVAEAAAAERAAAEQTLAAAVAAAKTAATAAAEQTDPQLKQIAQEAAAQAAGHQQAAEKLLAERTAAANAANGKAGAAETTLRHTEAAAAWDAHDRAGIELLRAEQRLREKVAAAQQLAERSTAEQDPAKKQQLQPEVAKAEAEKVAAERVVAQQKAALSASGHRVYTLRVAALGGLPPLAPDAWDFAKARHLLLRAGFGGTPQQVQQLCDLGLYRAVDHLVNFHQHPFVGVPFDAVVPPAGDPLEARLRIPGAQARAAAARPRSAAYNAQHGRLADWWLKRMVESPRPLQEKLALFWHGHFATQISVVQSSYAVYQHNQLLREHGAGSFSALLYGIAHDPAMIRYLDNNSNVKGHANENLAREIMELFSMGANQGYTETDIRAAARALTGYTFDPQSGQFRFLGGNHDETAKKVFGQEGNWTGDDVVKLILEQPATSRYIARRLIEFFALSEPTPDQVESVAALLRAHNYELSPVLSNLFLSEAFYSPQAMGTQIKCPVQLAVGTLRTFGVERVADAASLHQATTAMGQQLFEPPDVKGWRYGRTWINSSRVFVRYNSVADLVRGVPLADGRRGIDMVAFVASNGCKNVDEVVDCLIRASYATPLDAEKRSKLIEQVKDLPPVDQWGAQRDTVNVKLQNLLILVTSTPEYQVN